MLATAQTPEPPRGLGCSSATTPAIPASSAIASNQAGSATALPCLQPPALQAFVQAWEARLDTPFSHPDAGLIRYRDSLMLQVQEYIACLLEPERAYRPLLLGR